MLISLIRHGMTKGNLQKRYVGTTNEPLCVEGIDQLKSMVYPKCDVLYCSPMDRCIQTAKIIYPDMEVNVVENFREIDFGDFEGRNYLELSNNVDYQSWIDSGGTLPFPHGESMLKFSERSYRAFKDILFNCDKRNISMVVHGGTIMAIMGRLNPKANYFDFQVKNGQYITIEV